ncbi:hypothetical protein QVD17_02058 [Tagetes erecta]|uniref:Uncharacterized protein n=1 Tax=Tagetes erecta TaxID=13708 RepID=A0AAD8P8I2_TARER|nr:hypothetical protein QVD17_02058 [Tagetes erecta]
MASYTDNMTNWKPRKVSAKRDYPDAFVDHAVTQLLLKKQKLCDYEHLNTPAAKSEQQNDDFIPPETDSASSEAETRGSDCDIIPRIINNICNTCSDDEDGYNDADADADADADDDDAEVDEDICDYDVDGAEINKSGRDSEVRLYGVCMKEIKLYQKRDGLKIELSVDKLVEKNIKVDDDESLGIGSRRSQEGVNYKRDKTYEKLCSSGRRLVPAVRCFPPGCGPDAALLSDEDLRLNEHIHSTQYGREAIYK